MPWSDGSIKSMVEIELKTLKEKKKKALLSSASHIRAISAPSPTHFPGATSSQVFPPARSTDGSPSLAATSDNPPPFLYSLSIWMVGHFLLYFPRTLLYSSCPPDRGLLSRKPAGTLNSFSFSSCVLGAHLYRDGSVI